MVYGSGDYQYEVVEGWGQIPVEVNLVGACFLVSLEAYRRGLGVNAGEVKREKVKDSLVD